MARYDRIAPISAPARECVFPAWLVLRDLEGRDRDADLARRARLRYLAIRPVRRLLDRGMSVVGLGSYIDEIEVAREDLGYLPARDPERTRLARFLHQIEQREPATLIPAVLELAEACAAAGHTYGAEEFALTAQGLATASGDDRLDGVAVTVRARIYRDRGQHQDAESCATRAVEIAQRTGNYFDLVRARAELALALAAQQHAQRARATLEHLLDQMRSARDVLAEALAEARSCTLELALDNPAAALEHGGRAFRHLEDARERVTLLEDVGRAFAAVGLHKVAERCFAIVVQRASDPALRARARAARAVQVAATENVAGFREQRAALLADATEWQSEPRASCFVHIELGRGCTLSGDVDFARDHLRNAITLARKHGLMDMLASAETVLSALEANEPMRLAGASDLPSLALARSIAEQVESLPDFLPVPA